MKINWLGHASFIIESHGMKLMTDPFDEKLGYPLSSDLIDVVTVSHQHWDHNAVEAVKGSPTVFAEVGEYSHRFFNLKGVKSYHDKSGGKERGSNIIFKISAEGINLVHLGDLGHVLSGEQVQALGDVDILIVPVGGNYTVNAEEAYQIVKQLKPLITIPMHFDTPHLSFELETVEKFLAKFDKVVKKPYLEISRQDIESMAGVIVLDYEAKVG